MKAGDLVQVLPAKIGYYIITTEAERGHIGGPAYWNLAPVCKASFDMGGPMSEEYIEVVSEGT